MTPAARLLLVPLFAACASSQAIPVGEPAPVSPPAPDASATNAPAPDAPTPVSRYNADGNRVISQAQIVQWNAVDAMEVIERSAMSYTVSGNSMRSKRGEASILDRSAVIPVIYVDNVRMYSPAMLRQIPAPTIDHIEIVSPMNASMRYGVGANAGAVLVFTKTGDTP